MRAVACFENGSHVADALCPELWRGSSFPLLLPKPESPTRTLMEISDTTGNVICIAGRAKNIGSDN